MHGPPVVVHRLSQGRALHHRVRCAPSSGFRRRPGEPAEQRYVGLGDVGVQTVGELLGGRLVCTFRRDHEVMPRLLPSAAHPLELVALDVVQNLDLLLHCLGELPEHPDVAVGSELAESHDPLQRERGLAVHVLVAGRLVERGPQAVELVAQVVDVLECLRELGRLGRDVQVVGPDGTADSNERLVSHDSPEFQGCLSRRLVPQTLSVA